MLLQRALNSLLAQTYPHWQCMVFDDSPESEGASVVGQINDKRILYKRNPRRMGAEGNIDQAFRKAPYIGGDFFCVLEDDNYLLPDFLAENIFVCESEKVPVVFRNQAIELVPDQDMTYLTKGTLDNWYEVGLYTPQFAWAEMIFNLGISNGSLFWSKSAVSDFEVKIMEVSSVIQENMRAILLQDCFYVAKKPLAVFRGIEEESLRTPLMPARYDWKKSARILQHLRQTALQMIQSYDTNGGVLLNRRLLRNMVEREAALYRINRPWPCRPAAIAIQRRLELRLKALALEVIYEVPPSVKQKALCALNRSIEYSCPVNR